MFQISKREAAQIQVGDKRVIRRAWYKCNHEAGSKIPVFLAPMQPAVFVLEVLGVVEETVDQVTDAKAREEGFKDRADWERHWKLLYKDGRAKPDTRIFALRFRKGSLVHNRRKVIDGMMDAFQGDPN
jgi:hypothetical protein